MGEVTGFITFKRGDSVVFDPRKLAYCRKTALALKTTKMPCVVTSTKNLEGDNRRKSLSPQVVTLKDAEGKKVSVRGNGTASELNAFFLIPVV